MISVDKKDINLLFEQDRLDSFAGKWKTLRGSKNCIPSKFASAGFYYAGSKSLPDNVKCFICQKELNQWEKDDDPWEEHKKRGNKCMFVKLKQQSSTITVKDILYLYFEMRKNSLWEAFQKEKSNLEKNFSSVMDILINAEKSS